LRDHRWRSGFARATGLWQALIERSVTAETMAVFYAGLWRGMSATEKRRSWIPELFAKLKTNDGKEPAVGKRRCQLCASRCSLYAKSRCKAAGPEPSEIRIFSVRKESV
jgi:hypothetical protein